MADRMQFPKTMKEFIDSFSFKDREEIYTNGAELIPVFRVEQAFEYYEKEIRNNTIDEFAERLKEKILEEIDDVSESQRNYEVGSDMSLTCSHIMGTLRDVYHRVIDEIAEEMKEGGV